MQGVPVKSGRVHDEATARANQRSRPKVSLSACAACKVHRPEGNAQTWLRDKKPPSAATATDAATGPKAPAADSAAAAADAAVKQKLAAASEGEQSTSGSSSARGTGESEPLPKALIRVEPDAATGARAAAELSPRSPREGNPAAAAGGGPGGGLTPRGSLIYPHSTSHES